MSKASESLQRRFGQNLSESLGVRATQVASHPPLPRSTGHTFPRESGPDDGRTRAREAGHMELSRIVPDPDQPRKEFSDDAIERLSASLIKHGQLMPIRVRWNPTIAKWVVISGERRYRAAVRAGLTSVACVFAEDGLSNSEILQEQIVENLLREDLKPIEQARAYRQLMDLHNWTAKELSGELQVSQGAISKSLSLLNLPEEFQTQVDQGTIPATSAYEIAKVEDFDKQKDVVRRVVDEKLSRDAVTELVREVVAKPIQVREPRTKPTGSSSSVPTPRTIKTADAKIVVSAHNRSLSDDELIEILEQVIRQIKSAALQSS